MSLRIGSGATACLSVALQSYKSITTKSSKDISHGLIILGYASTILGTIYGFKLRRSEIYGSNLALLANYVILHIIKFRNDYYVQTDEESETG
jgi:uncharacterized protein with PQ loop repeat